MNQSFQSKGLRKMLKIQFIDFRSWRLWVKDFSDKGIAFPAFEIQTMDEGAKIVGDVSKYFNLEVDDIRWFALLM